MIENIVARAKKQGRQAIDRPARSAASRPTTSIDAVREEFKENEDLPNTTNPDDWARISGRKGERIINVRTLITGHQPQGTSIEDVPLGPVSLGTWELRAPLRCGGPGRDRFGRGLRMAIPKVMGTEIEYGITVKNDPDFDPISSCVLLVNAYREDHSREILWDYDQENPLADARGFQVDGEKYTPEPAGEHRPQQDAGERRALLRRPRAPRVLVPGSHQRPRFGGPREGGRAHRRDLSVARPTRCCPPAREMLICTRTTATARATPTAATRTT